MGNGAKAQQRRERGAKDAQKGGKSQLKSNAASKTIICSFCRKDFMSTTREPQLVEHAQKHSMTMDQCFA